MNGNSAVLQKMSLEGSDGIYTDGSFKSNAGSWPVVIEGEEAKADMLPHTCVAGSSTTPELVAILQAVRMIISRPSFQRSMLIRIFSDSAESIKFVLGIHSPTMDTSDEDLVQQIRTELERASVEFNISLEWVKGHAGILGNEMANRAAGEVLDRWLSKGSQTDSRDPHFVGRVQKNR